MAASSSARSLQNRAAAHTRWSRCEDRKAALEPARSAFLKRFEDEVDPERTLSPEERARRTASAQSAYYLKLAAAGVAARKAKREGKRAS